MLIICVCTCSFYKVYKQIIDILLSFLTEYSHQRQWLSECDDGRPRSAVSVMASYPQQDATGRKWSVPLPCYCISTTFIYQFFSHKSVPVHCISSTPIYQCRFYVFVSSHVSVPLQKCFILKYITCGFCWSLKLSCNMRRITFIIFTCSISSGAMWGM